MLTDPIADMLTRIRNGLLARHDQVSMPYSRMREGIAKILVDEGFLTDFATEGEGHKKELLVTLKYDKQQKPVIEKIQRVSRPGLRIYRGKDSLPLIQRGLGVAIISTSQGLMVDREARSKGVGGEVLCQIW